MLIPSDDYSAAGASASVAAAAESASAGAAPSAADVPSVASSSTVRVEGGAAAVGFGGGALSLEKPRARDAPRLRPATVGFFLCTRGTDVAAFTSSSALFCHSKAHTGVNRPHNG